MESFQHHYYICTDCRTYSTGGIYTSLCRKCDQIVSNPPQAERHQFLCTRCARQYSTCQCDVKQPSSSPSPSPTLTQQTPPLILRPHPTNCFSKCCTCWTYTCSCTCCHLFSCECLSAPCTMYEPCCYCTRPCSKGLCFWSWCPCSCTIPPKVTPEEKQTTT